MIYSVQYFTVSITFLTYLKQNVVLKNNVFYDVHCIFISTGLSLFLLGETFLGFFVNGPLEIL